MMRSQLELLVLYQDINLMLQEAEEEEKTLGFSVEGIDELKKAQTELAQNIKVHFLRTYKRLKTRFRRVIVPVKDDICLGCFSKLPTSYATKHRNDQMIISCENCGRILYWLD